MAKQAKQEEIGNFAMHCENFAGIAKISLCEIFAKLAKFL